MPTSTTRQGKILTIKEMAPKNLRQLTGRDFRQKNCSFRHICSAIAKKTSPLRIISALFCGTGGVDDANTTGCSSLVPPWCVTATDGVGFWFTATIDILDSDPAPVPCSYVNEGTIKGWAGWVISGTGMMAEAGGIPLHYDPLCSWMLS